MASRRLYAWVGVFLALCSIAPPIAAQRCVNNTSSNSNGSCQDYGTQTDFGRKADSYSYTPNTNQSREPDPKSDRRSSWDDRPANMRYMPPSPSSEDQYSAPQANSYDAASVRARDALIASADAGNHADQYQVGMKYSFSSNPLYGFNNVKAVAYLEKAAPHLPAAAEQLGDWYRHGAMGLSRQPQMAEKMYRLSSTWTALAKIEAMARDPKVDVPMELDCGLADFGDDHYKKGDLNRALGQYLSLREHNCFPAARIARVIGAGATTGDVTRDRKILAEAADSGSPSARFLAAHYYMNGTHAPRDWDLAHRWLKAAAASGDEAALETLEGFSDAFRNKPGQGVQDEPPSTVDGPDAISAGRLYLQASEEMKLPPEDRQEARIYRRLGKASELGFEDATYWYGKYKFHGRGVPSDGEGGFRLILQAANEGHGPAATELGRLYSSGTYVARDAAEARNWYRKAAELNDADGAFRLSEMAFAGQGGPFSIAEGKKWLERAAAQFQPDAMFKLAELLTDGSYDYTLDGATALTLFAEAFNKRGPHIAAHYVGTLYYSGQHGAPKDVKQAFIWQKAAADIGVTEALLPLSVHYRNGAGVEASEVEANRWLQKAAERHVAAAQNELGVCYYKGIGGWPQDHAEAVKWFRRAADQKDTKAQRNLAKLTFLGHGVSADIDQAKAMLDSAAAGGLQEARLRLEELASTGTINWDQER